MVAPTTESFVFREKKSERRRKMERRMKDGVANGEQMRTLGYQERRGGRRREGVKETISGGVFVDMCARGILYMHDRRATYSQRKTLGDQISGAPACVCV